MGVRPAVQSFFSNIFCYVEFNSYYDAGSLALSKPLNFKGYIYLVLSHAECDIFPALTLAIESAYCN